ncbi:hypothetical protein [Flavobacterium sp. C3NV]|uniref:hypothetical protein n=1 Tax=Flavobacterium sp. C3NV TaxID=3393358 RepID=UPI00398FE8D4
MMNNIYPLEWFDALISHTLNPKKTNITKLSKQDIFVISNHIEKESKNIQNSLKKEIFLLRKKREVRLQVRKYHSNLVFLLDNVIEYQKTGLFESSELSVLLELLRDKLEELLSIVENRFSIFLSLDERVPITYLMLSRNELQFKLEKLSKKVDESFMGVAYKIIIHSISQFIETFSTNKITYRQLLYPKDLLRSLKSVNTLAPTNFFSEIDKLLIEKNFNSVEYIDHIIDHINEEINLDESTPYRIAKLLFYKKEVDRIYSNEKVSFDPCRNNIKPILENWLTQEIIYLEKTMELNNKTNSDNLNSGANSTAISSKIECDLSIDQMALILRATDEARVIKARSMNHFFRMIIPHLSTPFKKDLSYQSVRSKSYSPEDRDKEIAIKILEKIITKIQSY